MLANGGKFIPTPPKPPASAFMDALDVYQRAIRLRFMFGQQRAYDSRYHVPNPSFVPQSAPPPVEGDLARLRSRFQARACALQAIVGPSRPNLSPLEREALRALRIERAVLVKPADKNLGLTLVGRAWYMQECNRQLADASTYKPIAAFNMSRVKAHANGLIAILRHIIPVAQHKWLDHRTALSQRLPDFYILPKLHKNPVKGRPIVASQSWVTTPLSAWCSHKLNVVMRKLPSVLPDTPELQARLLPLHFNGDEPVTLFTADVESLYTSIPIHAAIEAVRHTAGPLLDEPELLRPLLECVKFVLENNFFNFDGTTYHQIKGLAMGTPLAPPVANIFMASLEERMFNMSPELKPCFYGRYLDDILVVVRGQQSASAALWLAMCNMHADIHLSREVSASSVSFLDLVVYRLGDRLAFRVHQKALNRYLYVTPRSFHPDHVLRGFIRTELTRYARNSTLELDFVSICRTFLSRLRERGFRPSFLRPIFCSVRFPAPPLQRSRGVTPIVYKILFSPATRLMAPGQLLHEWYASCSDMLKARVPAPVVCYLLASNLYKLLVRAQVPSLLE